MKSLNIKYQHILLVAIVLTAAAIIRFYSFENRINFGPEQAMSLTVSGNYIQDGFSLLGQSYLERTTNEGFTLFTSALFDYSLVPLQIIFNYDPISITFLFALINLLTGFLLFWVLKKIFNFKVALFALILFLFNSIMISHSMFIWIVNYLPLVGVGIIYFLWKFYKSKEKYPESLIYSGVLGLLSGVGIGLEYGFATTILFILIFIFIFSKRKILDLATFIIGCILGTFPLFIFELRNNFYNLTTLVKYLSEGHEIGLVYYHYLHFWPILATLGALLLGLVYKKNKTMAVVVLFVYIFYNLMFGNVSFERAVGMSPNFTIRTWQQAAQMIASDKPKNYNITSLIDFDSRASPLRYYLQFIYKNKPMGVTQYPNAGTLYVLADKGYNFDTAIAWEINSFKPFNADVLRDLNNGYTVYKLTK